MNRNDIVNELVKHDQSVLSFPDRGPWGDSKYRGNCSGWIQAFLIWKYKVQKMAELFAGSGTGSDVCRDFGIKYIGADLNPHPVRGDILTVDAVLDDVPEEFLGADMVFMHPPYGAEIKIPYAGFMWDDVTGQAKLSDLGQMPWEQFMKVLNRVIMKYYSSMDSGARMSILMGDVRRNGLHSMLNDIVKPGELEQIIIKMQHNTVSGRSGNTYGGNRSFVPLVHEYLLVMKKPEGYIVEYQLPVKYSKDIRDSGSPTWRDVVYSVMKKLKKANISEIYSEIEGHDLAKKVVDWKAKVRQTLQVYNVFESTEKGVWALAA